MKSIYYGGTWVWSYIFKQYLIPSSWFRRLYWRLYCLTQCKYVWLAVPDGSRTLLRSKNVLYVKVNLKVIFNALIVPRYLGRHESVQLLLTGGLQTSCISEVVLNAKQVLKRNENLFLKLLHWCYRKRTSWAVMTWNTRKTKRKIVATFCFQGAAVKATTRGQFCVYMQTELVDGVLLEQNTIGEDLEKTCSETSPDVFQWVTAPVVHTSTSDLTKMLEPLFSAVYWIVRV